MALLHWPCGRGQPWDGHSDAGTDNSPTSLRQNAALWAGLQQAQAMGLARAIGVSNYNVSHIEALPTKVHGAAPTPARAHAETWE